MIKQFIWEYYGHKLRRTYSDLGHKIIQHPTEIVYDAADDMVGSLYTYTESRELVCQPDEPITLGPDSVGGFIEEL